MMDIEIYCSQRNILISLIIMGCPEDAKSAKWNIEVPY